MGGMGTSACLFSLCLTGDFLVCSSNIICRFSFSGASFLNSNNSGISFFCYMGDYITVSIPPAHSVPVAVYFMVESGIASRLGLHCLLYIFWLSFSFQHSLNKKQRVQQGLGRCGNWWVDPLLTVINAGFFSQSLTCDWSLFQKVAPTPVISLTLLHPIPHLNSPYLFILWTSPRKEFFWLVSCLAAFLAPRKVLEAIVCLGWCFALDWTCVCA